MNDLIDTLNKIRDSLQEANVEFDFKLPQIVVLGEQSSGKTSVLENFIGRDFLPRGTGIVTRRPLILQLIQSFTNCEYGEFLHLKHKQFIDFEEIKNEIVKETDRLLGKNCGISDVPISLKIYSPNVINLTVIDLPGLTKIAINNQSADIPQKIENLALSYISNPNSIILVVVPAITDLANSDALKIAKTVDPNCLL
ncbi:hypothetical protein MXB_2434 [Myxobolus squamalis]|nr:hypothetical protein MXB_2434 [Myxobolus squamalis]